MKPPTKAKARLTAIVEISAISCDIYLPPCPLFRALLGLIHHVCLAIVAGDCGSPVITSPLLWIEDRHETVVFRRIARLGAGICAGGRRFHPRHADTDQSGWQREIRRSRSTGAEPDLALDQRRDARNQDLPQRQHDVFLRRYPRRRTVEFR